MSEKPLRADARRNREEVLRVARELFADAGLSAPVEEIARRAGVGVGTIYRQFPTKEDLFGAVAEDRMRTVVDRARELEGSDDPGAAFFTQLAHVIEHAMQNRALFETVTEFAGAGSESVVALGAEMQEVQGELLYAAQRAGAVREDICIGDLKMIIKGCMAMANESGDRERMISIIRDGLRPR